MTTAKTNQLTTQRNNWFTILQEIEYQEPTIIITTMEQVPTETKEPVKEKCPPTVIKSKHISLGYLGKDSYYYETKEEALLATHPKTRAQQLIDKTVKRAMINMAFKKVLQYGQQGLWELEQRLQNLQKKK